MQALSFAVHIPLVCFGIAFPAMVLFVEWLYLRTGDALYRTLARRWTKVMARAVRRRGRHRHDPQLRDGAAVAELHRHLRQRVRARVRDRGLLVLPRGDLHRDLRLRLGPPVAACAFRRPASRSSIAGMTGSLMVISVNGWMNHPQRLRHLRGGKAVDVHPVEALFGNSYFWHELVHMYLAGYIVTGFLVAGVVRVRAAARTVGPLRAHGAGDPADDRCAWPLAGPGASSATGPHERWRAPSPPSSPPSRGSAEDDARRTGAPARLVHRRQGQVRDRGSRSCSRSSPTTTRTRECRDSMRSRPDRPSAGERRPLRVPDSWSGSARC